MSFPNTRGALSEDEDDVEVLEDEEEVQVVNMTMDQ